MTTTGAVITIMPTTMTTIMTTDPLALLRLLSWLSPSFPVGGFAHSHGLEAAFDRGIVTDADTLRDWLDGAVTFGSARNDAVILSASHESILSKDESGLRDIADLARCLFGAPELAGESVVQGNAFWRTVTTAWPDAAFDDLRAFLPEGAIVYPVAVGVASAVHGVGQLDAITAFLHGFAGNGVSAAIRLGIIGQTDGQRVTRALEGAILETAAKSRDETIEDIGSASLTIDMMALVHETQTTRLFRS
jgi:urease accessory protein